MTVLTFWFSPPAPALLSTFCPPGSSISDVWVTCAVVFPGTWHKQAQRSMASLAEAPGLYPAGVMALFLAVGASGFRNMNVITLRQNTAVREETL